MVPIGTDKRRQTVFQAQDPRASLSTLVDQRAALRLEQVRVQAALAEVQHELRGWHQERQSRGPRAPASLRMLWADLEERERELVLVLMRVQAARGDRDREIMRYLQVPPLAS